MPLFHTLLWSNRSTLRHTLRAAPKIFTALADAMEWIFKRNRVADIWHYLDDLITVSPPDSDECQANIAQMVELCSRLSVPLAEDKLIGACNCLVFWASILIHLQARSAYHKRS